MKKYPFVKQQDLKDCACACVLMILKYYGGYVSMSKLNEILCTDRNGTTAFHIVEGLKSLGFESFGYKYNDFSMIKVPCIIHVNINSYSHYMVLYEINFKKKKLIIADPNKEIIKYDFDSFLKIWTGYVIEMTPIRTINNEKKPKIKEFLLSIINPNIHLIILISVLSNLLGICLIANSFFIQGLIERLNIENVLYKFIYIMIFIKILSIIFNYLRNNLLIKLNMNIEKYLSMDTFSQIIYLPYLWRERKTTGEITSYFNDLLLIKKFITYLSTSVFIDFPLIIFLSITILLIRPYLFFINTFILILYFMTYIIYNKKTYILTDEVLRKKAQVNSSIVEYIDGFETIKNIGKEKKIIKLFNNEYINYLNINKKLEKTKNHNFLFNELINTIFLILLISFGIYSLRRNLNIGTFITIYFLSVLLINSFNNILSSSIDFKKIISAINHIQELLSKKNIKNEVEIKGIIKIQNLSFSYDKINNTLESINLKINIGEKVLVTGKSGSGKSTLFKIIKGYYDNYNGKALVDEKNCKNYYFRNILYVSSNDKLFTGRIKDNLQKNYKQSSEICELNDFITNYDMLIEENGFNLSNGQKQRISLARSLSDFNILIIDEGLSQVDVNMERRILKKIFSKYSKKTIIFISHRLDNLDLFTRFLKLDKGKLVLDETRHN